MPGLWFGSQFDEQDSRSVVVKNLAAESAKAIAIKDGSGELVWLPKSQIQMTNAGGHLEITIPAWLAEKHPELEYKD